MTDQMAPLARAFHISMLSERIIDFIQKSLKKEVLEITKEFKERSKVCTRQDLDLIYGKLCASTLVKHCERGTVLMDRFYEVIIRKYPEGFRCLQKQM